MSIVFGVAAVQTWRHTRHALESRRWPFVEGEIVRSEVVRDYVQLDGSAQPVWVPDVEYTYTVCGSELGGTRIGFVSAETSSRDRAERKAKEYFERRRVPVYYNPEDPGDSCLEPARSSGLPGYAAAVLLGAASIGALGAFAFHAF